MIFHCSHFVQRSQQTGPDAFQPLFFVKKHFIFDILGAQKQVFYGSFVAERIWIFLHFSKNKNTDFGELVRFLRQFLFQIFDSPSSALKSEIPSQSAENRN